LIIVIIAKRQSAHYRYQRPHWGIEPMIFNHGLWRHRPDIAELSMARELLAPSR